MSYAPPQASYMLSHGAELVVTAEDAFNPSVDPDNHPQSVFPLPGPGMFAAMFRKLMYPRGEGASLTLTLTLTLTRTRTQP